MKKVFLILSFLIFGLVPLATAKGIIADGVYLTHDRDGIHLFENYVDLKREGLLMEYFNNGDVGKIFPYHQNELQGFAGGYYPNQRVQYRVHFKDGIRNGSARRFYLSGQVAVELNYRDGKPDGVARFYNEQGKMERVALYSWGKLLRVGHCDPSGNIESITE